MSVHSSYANKSTIKINVDNIISQTHECVDRAKYSDRNDLGSARKVNVLLLKFNFLFTSKYSGRHGV